MDPQSNQQGHNTPPLPPLPPSPAGSSSGPHPSHEGHAPAPPPPAPAPVPPAAQPTAFRKPIPLPMPIAMPAPAHIGGVVHQSPVSAPQTPSILRMSSPNPYSVTQDNNAVAGPSGAGKQKQRSTPHGSEEEDNAATPGAYNEPTRQLTMNAQGDGGDNGASSAKDYGMPTPRASTRYPTRTGSTGRPAMDRNSRSIVLTEPVGYPGGNGFAQELSPSGLTSRPSVIDHVVPTMPATAAGMNGHRRRQSMAMSAGTVTIAGERTVEERMQPTLAAAIAERDKAALKGEYIIWPHRRCSLTIVVSQGTCVGAQLRHRRTSRVGRIDYRCRRGNYRTSGVSELQRMHAGSSPSA